MGSNLFSFRQSLLCCNVKFTCPDAAHLQAVLPQRLEKATVSLLPAAFDKCFFVDYTFGIQTDNKCNISFVSLSCQKTHGVAKAH